MFHPLSPNNESYWYRLKTIDRLKLLDNEIDHVGCHLRRYRRETLHKFLLKLEDCLKITFNSDNLRRFCWLCEAAEYSRNSFGEAHYKEFAALLDEIIACVKDSRQCFHDFDTKDYHPYSSKQPLMELRAVSSSPKRLRTKRGKEEFV